MKKRREVEEKEEDGGVEWRGGRRKINDEGEV